MLFMDESLAPNNSVIPHGRISQAVNYETPEDVLGGQIFASEVSAYLTSQDVRSGGFVIHSFRQLKAA